MREVAARADFSRSSLYAHLSGKEEILTALAT
jgi:AcrR family transcriptional regulator